MISLGEARRHVLDRVPRGAAVPTPVGDALGLVLAESVAAGEAVPPFANTAMDGFAVHAADTVGAPVELEIVETIAAGHAPVVTVQPGQASRIFTGAPMPDGADAVVMVERTEALDERTVRVDIEVPVGNHVRPAGDDLSIGQTVFDAGVVLSAGHLGVLNSLGVEEVLAYPRLRVGVVSTGDELVEGGGVLEPGQIRDSNRRTLLALAAQSGCDVVDLGIARDTDAAITEAIERGVADCDAVLTSGGVSMGDIDLVRVVLDRIGDMRWMQIAIKPAKPFAFGLVDGTPVFGFPGNPVSSMVSFELLGRPALRQAMGHADLDRPLVRAVADDDFSRRDDGKTHFARVVAEFGSEGRVHVRSAGGQGSHHLGAMATANALAVLPSGDGVGAGAEVEVLLLGEMVSPTGLPIDPAG
ncbi:molybdopterin molybdotransferase MoeA [Actinospongicola halichondriae]|uniref:molybdopterin molybdotransferase MoeA n=1 Tax=Actinospongicola halichondriae TaxID=3236844 RepID=UPI003D59EFF1